MYDTSYLKRIPESIEISLPNDWGDGLEHFNVIFDLQQLCGRGRRQVQLVAECPAHGDKGPGAGDEVIDKAEEEIFPVRHRYYITVPSPFLCSHLVRIRV